MSFRIALNRIQPTRAFTPLRVARPFSSTTLRRTTAGYGDPQDEKAQNHTPTPSSSADPQPQGHGKKTGESGGTTDPEVKKKTGNAGGDGGKRSSKTPSAKEVKETKKIGESPKKEKADPEAGPIGG